MKTLRIAEIFGNKRWIRQPQTHGPVCTMGKRHQHVNQTLNAFHMLWIFFASRGFPKVKTSDFVLPPFSTPQLNLIRSSMCLLS